MLTEKVVKFLNELLEKGYNMKVENEDISKEERTDGGNLRIVAKDKILKKEYRINISIMEGVEYICNLIPVTDKDKIDENYLITHCSELNKSKDSYYFEHKYKYVDNILYLNYVVHEWKDMNDENFFDDDDIIFEDTEAIDIKHILEILKNNFSIEQLNFIK